MCPFLWNSAMSSYRSVTGKLVNVFKNGREVESSFKSCHTEIFGQCDAQQSEAHLFAQLFYSAA